VTIAPETEPETAPTPDRALAVLGLLATSEMAAFSRLAGDADVAPLVADRAELCRLGGVAAERLGRLSARIAELGGSLPDAVAPFLGAYSDLDARMPARSWWERLVKAYVGFGVEDDVARLLAEGLDPTTRALVLDVLDDDGHAAFVVERVTAATAADPVLASRLALWARRLVGEALGIVQQILADHPDLRALVDAALPGDAPLQQRLFAVLTAEHTRRMGRLGLTA